MALDSLHHVNLDWFLFIILRMIRHIKLIGILFQVKVQGQNEEMLHAACQQFLGKSEAEIRKIALETLVSISFYCNQNTVT